MGIGSLYALNINNYRMFQFNTENEPRNQDTKFHKKSLHFRVKDKDILKFVKDGCQSYFTEIIEIAKVERNSTGDLEKSNQLQPRSSFVFKPKKANVFTIKNSRSVHKVSNGQKSMTSQSICGNKIRAKSTHVEIKTKEKQNTYCLPLKQKQSDNYENRLRIRKQEERRMQQKLKIGKDQQQKKQQKFRTFMQQNKSKQLCKMLACSYSGSSIPIVTPETVNRHEQKQIQFRILKPKEVEEQTAKGNMTKSRKYKKGSSKSVKFEEGKENARVFKELEIYSAENSLFLKNFNKIKLNSHVTVSEPDSIIQMEKDQPKGSLKRKKINNRMEKTSIKQQNYIWVADEKIMAQQFEVQGMKRSRTNWRNDGFFRVKSQLA